MLRDLAHSKPHRVSVFKNEIFKHSYLENINIQTSKCWSHGEVMVIYSQQLLRFCHWRLCHVRASFEHRAAEGTC